MLDTIKLFETPEGVELELRVAGPGPRAFAWIIDALIWTFSIFVIYSVLITFLDQFGKGLVSIFMFLIWWFYDIYFEVKWNGATPGKKIMGLRVVHDDATPVNWSSSVTRNFLRSIDFLPIGYFAGFICSIFNRDFKRLGDLAAGTLVVYVDSVAREHKVPKLSPLPTPVSLKLDEQRSIVEFAERSQSLSLERVAEIADILQPVTKSKGLDSANKITQYANWMLGRR